MRGLGRIRSPSNDKQEGQVGGGRQVVGEAEGILRPEHPSTAVIMRPAADDRAAFQIHRRTAAMYCE